MKSSAAAGTQQVRWVGQGRGRRRGLEDRAHVIELRGEGGELADACGDLLLLARVSLGFTDITAANVLQGPQRMMGSLGALDPIAKFSGIQAPTLVVDSELDPIPSEWSRFLAAIIPDADFELIEGGSHFPMVEDAEQLRATVVPWLRRHA